MELLCSVIEQTELQKRSITDSDGKSQVFRTIGVTLSHGTDTIHAEAVQDNADYLATNPLQKEVIYVARLKFTHRSYKTNTGEVKHTTDVRLVSINYL